MTSGTDSGMNGQAHRFRPKSRHPATERVGVPSVEFFL
jgi:hypothetical protein